MKKTTGPRSRRLRILFALSLIVLLSSFTFFAWLLSTENGAQFAASVLARQSAGTIQVDGVHGRLAGPLAIDRILISNSQQNITLMNLQLDWQPRELLRARLHVMSLHIDRMIISHKIEQRKVPARMPDNIALPFFMQIDQARIDSSEIGWGPVSIAQLGAVVFNLDYDQVRYRLQLEKLAARSVAAQDKRSDSIASTLSGVATLAVARPYALQADLLSGGEAVVQDQAVGINGRIKIIGSLQELLTTIDMTVSKSTVQGHATLRPFENELFVNAAVTAQAFDVSALSHTLPHTEIDFNLSADASGTGQFSLVNKSAGLYNEGKLPLTEMRATFHQQAGRLHVSQIVAALGTRQQRAGMLSGEAQYQNGALDASLLLKTLDLHQMDQRFHATRLTGKVGVVHVAGKQTFTVNVAEPIGKRSVALSAHATLADDRFSVDRAELRAGKGNLTASGHINLSGQNTFSADGQMNHVSLRELGEFEKLPEFDLNGKFSLRGARQPKLVADLVFNIIDSKLGDYPLQGSGQAHLLADRLQVPQLLLAVGVNRFEVHGELSGGDAQLRFVLDAPDLAQLGNGFGGALQAQGSAHGKLDEPHIDLTWDANKLRAPSQMQLESAQGKASLVLGRSQPFLLKSLHLDASARGIKTLEQQLDAFSAQIQFSPQDNAPLALSIQADGVTSSRLHADHFTAQAKGTTAQHTIDAAMVDADQKWTLSADGGLKDLARATRWQGHLNRVDAAGPVAGHLSKPASLSLSPQQAELRQFQFDANSATIVIEQFSRDQNGIATRGHVEHARLASILQFATQQPAITTDLQMAGEWDVNITNAVNGTIKLRRESGDILMQGGAAVPLGLRNIDASMQASNGQVTVLFDASGQRLGHVEMNAKGRLAAGASRFSISPNAPLTGAAKIDIPSLNWVGPMVSPSLITEGQLQSALAISGSFANPHLTGKISGNGLRFFFIGQGLDLRHGTLDGEFQNNGLLVKQLNFESPDGNLLIAGPINWNDGKAAAHLTLDANRFVVFNRVDRRLVLSGHSDIESSESKTKIGGAFKVDSGYFDIGRDDAPQLSDDVVIVGRTKKSAGRMGAEADIKIALGEGITLKGRGIDALLNGQIRVTSDSRDTLRADGALAITKGTYSAYGRKLTIEKGELRFKGPIDNPSLDFLAMQRGLDVEAGVAVRGTVLAPRITLVSEPSVPDAEKLSWLVLGHGLDTGTNADMSALQAAAAALLAKAAGGGQSSLATTFGLDEINISTAQTPTNTQERIVTFGKQLSSRLYVSYEQGFETASSVLHLRYTLSKRFSLEGEAGARSAISVFYNILFD